MICEKIAVERVVCEAYGITPDKLKSKCRAWNMVDAKQTIAFIRLEHCKETQMEVADDYGFSQPAILHSRKTAIAKLDGTETSTGVFYPYKAFKDKFDQITAALGFTIDIQALKTEIFAKQNKKLLKKAGISTSK